MIPAPLNRHFFPDRSVGVGWHGFRIDDNGVEYPLTNHHDTIGLDLQVTEEQKHRLG